MFAVISNHVSKNHSGSQVASARRVRRKALSVLAVGALLLVTGGAPAGAATWWASPHGTVAGSGTSPADPTTIHQAVLQASSGDEVVLLGGLYAVPYQITIDKELVIHSLLGPAVLNCAPNPQCMLFKASSGASELYDITLQNSGGISIVINNSSPSIHDVEITGSTRVGIDVNGTTAAPQIQDSLFVNNNNGIISYDTQLPLIARCWFENHAGRGILVQTNVVTNIVDNDFLNNYVGLEIGQGPNHALVRRNRFERNDWGVYIHTYGDANDNLIERNEFLDSGVIGTLVYGTGDTSRINANDFLGDDIAVYISGGDDDTQVTNNLIRDSLTHGVVSDNSTPIVAYNTIVSAGLDGIHSVNTDAAYVVNNITMASGGIGINVDLTSGATQVGRNDSFTNSFADFAGPFINLGGNLMVDPVFVGMPDFHLQCGLTPLLNQAGLFAVFQDHDFVLRGPLGGVPGAEIGAFECP